MKRIVYTAHDGTVRVCTPTRECMGHLQAGGFYRHAAPGVVRHAIEWEIERGRDPDEVRRWVHALAFGGKTEAEALALIRDKDCAPHGTAFDVIEPSDLPDRWFRNAWRRSHNGGPIMVDLDTAKQIQFARLHGAVKLHNTRSEGALRPAPKIRPEWGRIRDQIERAGDERELAAVWIEGLAR